jgi:hypothetical protein
MAQAPRPGLALAPDVPGQPDKAPCWYIVRRDEAAGVRKPALEQVTIGDPAVTRRARAARRLALLLAVLACVLGGSLGLFGTALADDGQQVSTATTQDFLDPVRGLSVVWHGKVVSALPFRIRLLGQASPLAYSLDVRRPAAYGDSWTGISLGRPGDPQDRSLAAIGIANPLVAEAIARGDAPVQDSPTLATSNEELAARQVAIWASTNNLPLTPKSVPDAALRRRAQQLLAATAGLAVPLQAASHHSVQIFVRDTTANTVQLAVTIGIDPGTDLTIPQHIDLYLDGVLCPIMTQALTHIVRGNDGAYQSDPPVPLDPATHSIDVAEVDLDRNTKVVDATVTWVNVLSGPGLVMAGADAAPPIITAEPAVLNFTSATELNPSDYTNPEQLLSNLGTAFLTTVHGWAVWVILVLGLYLFSRVGRIVDAAFLRITRRKPKEAPRVNPAAVEAEAATEDEAIRAGLAALNLTKPDDVVVTILQAPQHGPAGAGTPARVRLARRTRQRN